MNEDIKYLEDLIPFAKMLLTTSQRATIQEKEIEVLENIIARYKELEQENKILKNKQTKIIADSFHEKMAEKFDDDFIKKSKIKEILEQYKYTEIGDIEKIIEFYKKLQELLES